MKRYIFLFIISSWLLGSFSLFAQTDFKYIIKAQKIYDSNGNLDKALKLLDRAEGGNFGFCGNSYAEADWNIHHLRGSIYFDQGDQDRALMELDSLRGCRMGGLCTQSDSLKFELYKLKYGNEKVKLSLNHAGQYIFEKENLYRAGFVTIELDEVDTTAFVTLPYHVFQKLDETFQMDTVFTKLYWYETVILQP